MYRRKPQFVVYYRRSNVVLQNLFSFWMGVVSGLGLAIALLGLISLTTH